MVDKKKREVKSVEYIRIFIESHLVMFLSLGILYAIHRGIEKLIRMAWEGLKGVTNKNM